MGERGLSSPVAAAWERLRVRIGAFQGWRRRGVAAALGALAVAALPPVYAIFLLPVSFVGLIWLTDAAPNRRAVFGAGWWFGFGHFLAGFHWIAMAFLVDPLKYGWMGPFAVAGLAAFMALFPALAALTPRLCRAAGIGRIAVFAGAWALLEWVRGWLLTGFPWNPLGSVWAFSGAMIQPAAVLGVYGLSLATVLAAAMPAVLGDGGTRSRRGAVAVILAVGLLAGSGIGGALRLADAETKAVEGVRLRLVQPNIPQHLKWKPALRDRHVAQQVMLSHQPSMDGGPAPSHVIWPETSVPFFLERDAPRRRLVARAAPAGGAVIVGAPRGTPPDVTPYRVWNSLIALDVGGERIAFYDKHHLVPFGEYVPFRDWLPIAKLTAGATDFAAGPGLRTLNLPGLPPVGPLICYEIIFPGRVVAEEMRPEWLLNLTNDAWYGNTAGPYQHFAAARLRAVEEGLPVVRVATTGISGIIDPWGRVRIRIGLGREGFADGDLPAALTAPTPFARTGNILMVVVSVLIIAAGSIASRADAI